MPKAHRLFSVGARPALPVIACVLLCGCLENPHTLNGNMTMKLEPIQVQMQMQGPTIKYEGTYISDELVDRIKVGTTTDDWILAVLGEPSARSMLRDGTALWRWTYRPTMQEAAVVEVFGKDDKEPKLATRIVFVQFRDSVVIDKWKG